MVEQKQQSVSFAKQLYSYSAGTGKDAKVFIKFVVNENGVNKIFNIPLLTLNSVQVFTSVPKEPRYVFGKADPVGLSKGVTSVGGYITAVTFNKTIGNKIREELKDYQPVEGMDLNLDINGMITLDELDHLRHLDELPPCDIKIFLTNPMTKKVYSKTIYGCVFVAESHSIGQSAYMGEQYSFAAATVGPMVLENVKKVNE